MNLEERLRQRELARQQKNFEEADRLRVEIEKLGYVVEDTAGGPKLKPKVGKIYQKSSEMGSQLDQPDLFDFSLVVTVQNQQTELQRLVSSLQRFFPSQRRGEIIVVVEGEDLAVSQYLATLKDLQGPLKIVGFKAKSGLGEAALRNLGLRAARGRIVISLDLSVEITGDVFTPLDLALFDETLGLIGPFGLLSKDLHSFYPADPAVVEVDAQQLYFLAFRRSLISRVGLMREKFKFYRHLDLDFCFRIKEKGYRIGNLSLPVVRHQHHLWEEMDPVAREKKSRKNFYFFLDRWHDRKDLLVSSRRPVSRSPKYAD